MSKPNFCSFASFVLLALLILFLIGHTKFIQNDKPLALSPCSDEVILSTKSLHGFYVASIIERDCGATTDYAQYIYIKDASKQTPAPEEYAVAIVKGIGITNIGWKDEETLLVTYDPNQTKFFRKEYAYKAVKVLYKSK